MGVAGSPCTDVYGRARPALPLAEVPNHEGFAGARGVVEPTYLHGTDTAHGSPIRHHPAVEKPAEGKPDPS